MGGIVIAFKDYRYDLGIWGSPWIGFDNFKFFFSSGKAWLLTKNTIFYNAAFILTGILLQVGLAVILSEIRNKYFKKITHSIIFLPYFISWVTVSFMAYNLLNFDYGVINSFLRSIGLEPVNFYGTKGIWKYVLIAFSNWKGLGYGSVIYLAVITGISPELYESAHLDGADVWQRIRYITIPFLKTTIIILVLLSLGNILKGGADMFYQLIGNNSMLFNETDVIDVYILRSLINPLGGINYSMTTAIGLFQQAIGFALIMTVNIVVKRVNPDYALF
jgi:putative aldouronate transport system permease protein